MGITFPVPDLTPIPARYIYVRVCMCRYIHTYIYREGVRITFLVPDLTPIPAPYIYIYVCVCVCVYVCVDTYIHIYVHMCLVSQHPERK